MQDRPCMPTVTTIFRHWVLEMRTFPHLLHGKIRCFACDTEDRPLERAHLIPHAEGGGGSKRNLVLLCKRCHRDAPMIAVSRQPMIDWINNRESDMSFMARRISEEMTATEGFIEKVNLIGVPKDICDRIEQKLKQIGAGIHPGGDPTATIIYAASLVYDDMAASGLKRQA